MPILALKARSVSHGSTSRASERRERTMPQVTRLGHVGLFCNDLMKMRDFYSRVVGLTITDEDLDRGICFLSADPEAEHHELALARAKEPAQKTQNVQQVSFKVGSLDDVRAFYHRLQEEGLKIDRTVTHGIACTVYSSDPEDNRIELYSPPPTRCVSRWGQLLTWTKTMTNCWLSPRLLRPLWGHRAARSHPLGSGVLRTASCPAILAGLGAGRSTPV